MSVTDSLCESYHLTLHSGCPLHQYTVSLLRFLVAVVHEKNKLVPSVSTANSSGTGTSVMTYCVPKYNNVQQDDVTVWISYLQVVFANNTNLAS